MIREFRFAFRNLVKTPGFTLVAIITVALAIAANTAVFSLVNTLMFPSGSSKAPENLVLLFEKFSGQGLDQIRVSLPGLRGYTSRTACEERIAAFNFADFN